MKKLLSVILLVLTLSTVGQTISNATYTENISYVKSIIMETDAGNYWVSDESNAATMESLQSTMDGYYLNRKPLILNDKVCYGWKHVIDIQRGYKSIYLYDDISNLDRYSKEVLSQVGYELMLQRDGITMYKNCNDNTLISVFVNESYLISVKIEWHESLKKSFFGCPIKESN